MRKLSTLLYAASVMCAILAACLSFISFESDDLVPRLLIYAGIGLVLGYCCQRTAARVR